MTASEFDAWVAQINLCTDIHGFDWLVTTFASLVATHTDKETVDRPLRLYAHAKRRRQVVMFGFGGKEMAP